METQSRGRPIPRKTGHPACDGLRTERAAQPQARYGLHVIDLDADVLVLGAGVIGLSTAVCLAEAGVNVTVAAAEPPERTTSVAAGAIWGPHLVGVDKRVERWANETRASLAKLSHPELGENELAGIVHTATGIAASRESEASPPEFAATADSLGPCAPGEL